MHYHPKPMPVNCFATVDRIKRDHPKQIRMMPDW
jgi:hypothetical protein